MSEQGSAAAAGEARRWGMMTVPEGSVILREGEVQPELYKILRGHVELYSGYGTEQESLLGILGPQACFGELGILLEKPAIYTAVAYSDVLLLRVHQEELDEFVQKNQRNTIDIMRNMANTMTVLQKQIDMLAADLEEMLRRSAEAAPGDGAGTQGLPDGGALREMAIQSRRALRGYAVYQASALRGGTAVDPRAIK